MIDVDELVPRTMLEIAAAHLEESRHAALVAERELVAARDRCELARADILAAVDLAEQCAAALAHHLDRPPQLNGNAGFPAEPGGPAGAGVLLDAFAVGPIDARR